MSYNYGKHFKKAGKVYCYRYTNMKKGTKTLMRVSKRGGKFVYKQVKAGTGRYLRYRTYSELRKRLG